VQNNPMATPSALKPSEHLHRCGLSGTVWPQVARDFTWPNNEVDVIHKGVASKPLGQPSYFKHGTSNMANRPHGERQSCRRATTGAI
jgi:hypothetical protein